MIDERAVEIWNDELEELFLRTGRRFRRVEPRRGMRDYIRGLLGPVGRKNGRQLAERGHRRIHPPAQCPRRAEDNLRTRLTDPFMDRLPGQSCVTSH